MVYKWRLLTTYKSLDDPPSNQQGEGFLSNLLFKLKACQTSDLFLDCESIEDIGFYGQDLGDLEDIVDMSRLWYG